MSWNSDDRLEILLRQAQDQLRGGKIRDETAAEIFSLAYPELYARFKAAGCSPEDCKDLTQISLIRVFKGVGSFRFQSRCSTWMIAIGRRVFANYLRDRKTAMRQEDKQESLDRVLKENPHRLQGAGSSSAPDQLAQQLDREHHEALRRAVQSMPLKRRQCCFLYYVQGFKYRQIAVLMRISIGTVKSHLYQAREQIRAQVGIDPGDVPEE